MDIEQAQSSENKSEGFKSIKKNSMDEQSPGEQYRSDLFQRILNLHISQNQEKQPPDEPPHAKTSRKHYRRNQFRKILNSSSSNDRLIPSSLKHDSSRENSERAHNHYETENSLDQQSFHKSFKKRYQESFSVQNTVRDSSSEFSQKSGSRRSFIQILPPEYQQQFKQEQGEMDEQQKKISCNCKKSKCLKLYCQCFQRQLFCNQNCKCYQCGNHNNNDEKHQKAVFQALARNAHGFEDENFQNNQQKGFSLGVQIQQVKKGCKCKRTHCVKKYCQCYNNGNVCGIFCRCEDCFNTTFHLNKK